MNIDASPVVSLERGFFGLERDGVVGFGEGGDSVVILMEDSEAKSGSQR